MLRRQVGFGLSQLPILLFEMRQVPGFGIALLAGILIVSQGNHLIFDRLEFRPFSGGEFAGIQRGLSLRHLLSILVQHPLGFTGFLNT